MVMLLESSIRSELQICHGHVQQSLSVPAAVIAPLKQTSRGSNGLLVLLTRLLLTVCSDQSAEILHI